MVANAGIDCKELITLTATKVAPGRPSTHCVWRWCRRGVKARSGERVFLEHLRMGGKLVTSERWVRDFGQRLAAADQAHFQQRGGALAPSSSSATPGQSDLERELEEEGL